MQNFLLQSISGIFVFLHVCLLISLFRSKAAQIIKIKSKYKYITNDIFLIYSFVIFL